jgi:drug/metabolite transporter (DMT)-like permease
MARASGAQISVGGASILSRAQSFGQTRRGAFVTLLIANALWAGAYAAGKIALDDLNPFELNALRFTIAALVLSPALFRGWRRIPRDRRSLFTLAMLALLGFVLNKAFEYSGLALSTASDVALLIATESLFTAALSWTALRERLTATGVIALGAGLIGVYLVIERGFAPAFAPSGDSARVIGDLLVIFSLLLESGYTILGKRAVNQLPPLLFTAATLAGSLAIWVPAGVFSVARLGWPHITLAGWLATLYLALVATVAGYWLWFRGLAVVDASRAAPLLFIQPLLGAALGVWLLGDHITWATWAGGALIVASLLLVMRDERAKTAQDTEPSTVAPDESIP